ncbi:MAG: AsmA family protein, partial [Vicinamibacterales bacterium]
MLRRILVLLVILAVSAAGVIYWFFSGDGVRRALEQQATAWIGQPVAIRSATARIFPRVGIELGDVRIGDPVRVTLARVEVSTGLRPLLSRRIEDAALIVSDSRIEMPLPFSMPESGGASPAPDDAGAGITVVSLRAITLRDIRIVSRGQEIELSADSSLSGSRLDLSRFTARAGSTSLEASGVVELEPSFDAKLQVSAGELDLDDLVALADAFTPPPPRRPPSPKG